MILLTVRVASSLIRITDHMKQKLGSGSEVRCRGIDVTNINGLNDMINARRDTLMWTLSK